MSKQWQRYVSMQFDNAMVLGPAEHKTCALTSGVLEYTMYMSLEAQANAISKHRRTVSWLNEPYWQSRARRQPCQSTSGALHSGTPASLAHSAASHLRFTPIGNLASLGLLWLALLARGLCAWLCCSTSRCIRLRVITCVVCQLVWRRCACWRARCCFKLPGRSFSVASGLAEARCC